MPNFKISANLIADKWNMIWAGCFLFAPSDPPCTLLSPCFLPQEDHPYALYRWPLCPLQASCLSGIEQRQEEMTGRVGRRVTLRYFIYLFGLASCGVSVGWLWPLGKGHSSSPLDLLCLQVQAIAPSSCPFEHRGVICPVKPDIALSLMVFLYLASPL